MRKQKVYIFNVFFSNSNISKQVYMYMYMYMYISIYIWVNSPKQTPKNNKLKVNITEKKLSKLNIFNPTPPPAKIIKCMRSDAVKYESDIPDSIQTHTPCNVLKFWKKKYYIQLGCLWNYQQAYLLHIM